GDEPRAALEGNIGPEPVEQHREPIAEADQEEDVDGAPEEPGEPPAQLDEAEIADRDLAPDRRQVARVAVAEGGHRLAGEAGEDGPRRVGALLLGGGRDAGDGPARGVDAGGGVADDEDLGMPRHAEVGLDDDASGAVLPGAEPFRRRRGGDARRPDEGAGGD